MSTEINIHRGDAPQLQHRRPREPALSRAIPGSAGSRQGAEDHRSGRLLVGALRSRHVVAKSNLYLTAEDLKATTGYVQPAAQIRWLRKHGIRHFVGADGRPRVREKWLDGIPTSDQVERQEPNWGALAGIEG